MLEFTKIPTVIPIHPEARSVEVKVLTANFDKLSPLLKEAAEFLKNNPPRSLLYDAITIAVRPISAVRPLGEGEPERYGLGVVIHAVQDADIRLGFYHHFVDDLAKQVEEWIAIYWRGPVAMDTWDEGLNVVLLTQRDLKPWLPNGYYEGVRDTVRLA